jgi:hypothetical protein
MIVFLKYMVKTRTLRSRSFPQVLGLSVVRRYNVKQERDEGIAKRDLKDQIKESQLLSLKGT